MKQFLESFPVTGAGKVVHEEIHSGTHVKAELSDCKHHEISVGVQAGGAEILFEGLEHAADNRWNGQHEELRGQSDEHFGQGDLFRGGHCGSGLAAPPHDLMQTDGSDNSGNQDDDWHSQRDEKYVKVFHCLKRFLVPVIKVVDVEVPRLLRGTHLIEACHLVPCVADEAKGHQRHHADHNDGGQHFGRNAPLSSKWEQNTDAPLCCNDTRQQNRSDIEPVKSDNVVVDHVSIGCGVLLVVEKLRVDPLSV